MSQTALNGKILSAKNLSLAACSVLSFLLAAEACAAIDLTGPQQVAGQWDLALLDTNRKCRVTLRAEAAPGGFQISMPAGCRRALPILSDVGAWTLPDTQRLELADASGKLVLTFNASLKNILSARGPEGEAYEMVAANGVQVAQASKPVPIPGLQKVEPAAAIAPAAAKPTATAAAAPSAPAIAVKPSEVPGRYSIYRDGGKDTGCMLTLDDKAVGLKGLKAQLAPACRDQGLVIFDPAGWALEKGRLTLTARKGHQTHLDLQSTGLWLKDPKEGKGLSLKKF